MTKPIAGTVRNDEEVLNILGLNAIFKSKKNAMSKKINIDLLTANENTQVEKEKAKESMYDQPDVDRREEYVLPHVFYLRNLKNLHLAYNNIQDIPADFSILNSNLESLDLSFNLLTQINVSLCRGFSNLKFLNLESNKIKDMSDKLRELNELEYFNLNNNRLVTLSYELCFDLKRLKELHLSGNLLEKLPQFASTRKVKLKSGNSEKRSENAAARALTPSQAHLISSLKSSSSRNGQHSASTQNKTLYTFNLPNLNRIDLSNNKFKADFPLYNTFALCSRLTEIDLSCNKIVYVDTIDENEATSTAALEAESATVSSSATNGADKSNNFASDAQVRRLTGPKRKLAALKSLNLSDNEFYFAKGGFIRMLCDIYKLAPNMSTLHYDQINGNKLGIDLNAQKNKNSSLDSGAKNLPAASNVKVSTSTNADNAPNKKISEISVTAMLDNANTNAGPNANLMSTIDDHFYFDFNEKDEQILDVVATNSAGNGSDEQYVMIDCYERMLENLQILNLSNNNLTKIPPFVYKIKGLKQIYFNGNLLKRIPNELYKKPQSLEDELVFERLKQLQLIKIKEEQKRKRIENGEEEEEEEEPEEPEEPVEDEENTKKKKNKKKTKKELEKEKQEAAAEEERKRREAEALLQKDVKLVSDSLEIIHLNNNQIEYVPDSLFSNFKCLKEIKLMSNPLRDPPQESVCISAKLTTRNNEFKWASFGAKSESISAQVTTTSIIKLEKPASAAVNSKLASIQIPFMDTSSARQHDSKGLSRDAKLLKEDPLPTLPNLFFETNDFLKPLQSYMTKYKSREGKYLILKFSRFSNMTERDFFFLYWKDMILCNMFVLIKDNIESVETLYKLMRRLKMPMERVEYVCKEIGDSVAKNWPKIAAVEYPIVPGQLRLTQRELKVKMTEYTLKLQTWNLLSAWRNTFGTEAQSDEIIRIFKLMNSNQFEAELYRKLVSFKLSSNMFRV